MLKNKCILVYNLTDNELEKLKRLPFKVIEITKEMTGMTVKDVISGESVETVSETYPTEKVVLFNSFQDREIKGMVTTIRKIVNGGILAMVTPISINWTINYYIEHLIEERETMSKANRR